MDRWTQRIRIGHWSPAPLLIEEGFSLLIQGSEPRNYREGDEPVLE